MNNYNQATATHEQDEGGAEAFLGEQSMHDLVLDTLYASGRIDENCEVQPIEVERTENNPAYLRGAGPPLESHWRTDILVPNKQQTRGYDTVEADGTPVVNRVRWTDGHKVYNALTGRETKLTLAEQDVDQLQADKRRLLEATAKGDYEVEESDRQSSDAIFLRSSKPADPDFAATRIYLSGGTDAMDMARDIIDRGAQFESAKLWVPDFTTREQPFRTDTPILTVRTHEQLASTLQALREHYAGQPEWPADIKPPLGVAVPGVPGAYVGQPGNTSFNGRMEYLFNDPVLDACRSTELPSNGSRLTEEWLREAATKARSEAMAQADELDTDPHNHAFIKDQPVEAIMRTINGDSRGIG